MSELEKRISSAKQRLRQPVWHIPRKWTDFPKEAAAEMHATEKEMAKAALVDKSGLKQHQSRRHCLGCLQSRLHARSGQ